MNDRPGCTGTSSPSEASEQLGLFEREATATQEHPSSAARRSPGFAPALGPHLVRRREAAAQRARTASHPDGEGDTQPRSHEADRPSGRSRRYRWAGWVVILLVLVHGIGLDLGGVSDGEVEPFDIDELESSLVVSFEEAPVLGRAAVLNVAGLRDASTEGTTRVSVIHTAGINSYRAEHWVQVEDGRARLPVATSAMREAGVHTLTAFTDMQIGELQHTIRAGNPEPGFVPIVGPTRVIADGRAPVLVTINPTDRYGNPVDQGSLVQLTVRRPNGEIESFSSSIEDIITGVRVPSTTDVGVSVVVASVAGQPSEPVEFLQVPGPPAQLSLSTPSENVVADGRSVIPVKASEIADSAGNPVVDGTLITATYQSSSGSGSTNAISVNGEADFLIRAPSAPGTVDISVSGMAGASTGLSLDVGPAVGPFTATWNPQTGTVQVGPIVGWDGGFVADGAPVELWLDEQLISRSQVVDGMAELVPVVGADLAAAPLAVVTILGVSEAVTYEE